MISILRRVFIATIVFSGQVYAATICISPCNTEVDHGGVITAPDIGPIVGGVISLSRYTNLGEPTSILVDGDLYLDYSIFSDNEDLNIQSGTEITGTTVTIYQYSDTPTYPNGSYSIHQFEETNIEFQGWGNWVLFGSNIFEGAAFEATGNLYIGNYSSLAPVPLPPSAFLFLSSLLVPFIYKLNRTRAK